MKINELHVTFRVTTREREKRYGGITDRVLFENCQVVGIDGKLYYINPGLVVNGDEFSLCGPCAKPPRVVRFSIASGHGYDRRDRLSNLNDVAPGKLPVAVMLRGPKLNLLQ